MITTSVTYAARAAGQIQDTIYVLRLLDLSVDYSTDRVKGLSTQLLMVDRPALMPTEVNPLSAQSSAGSISVILMDTDSAITGLRQLGQVKGQPAEIWIGYKGMAWADYFRALKGTVTEFDRAPSGLSYQLEVTSYLDKIDIDIFTEGDLAAEPWMDGDREWDGGGLVLSDSDDDEVYDTVTLQGHPVEIGLKLLLSGGGTSDYDVYPAWAGAGLTTDEVDVEWCEAERDRLMTVEMRFTLTGAESVKSFIEAEICKPLGGYLLVSGSGKIRMRFPGSPNPTARVIRITDDHLVGKPVWRDKGALYVSMVRYELDHDGEGFALQLPPRESPQFLAGDVTEVREHPISSRGLHTDLGGISIADAITDQIFVRYGDQPPSVSFGTFFSKHLAEAGDVIELVTTDYPDWDGLGVGATRYLEALSVRPGPERVEFECIDLTTPLTSGTRAIIAPNGQADYPDATDAERVYAYLADGASGEFADGTPACVWS